MSTVAVYLDTNIISRIFDIRISEETAMAYRQLSEMQGLRFVTSAKTKQEMEQASNQRRASVLLFLYNQFAKTPWEVAEYSGAIGDNPIGLCVVGGGWTHPTLSKLRGVFDEGDAYHVFQASKAGCDYFLTLDEETILSRAKQNQELLSSICSNLKFRSPIELVQELILP